MRRMPQQHFTGISQALHRVFVQPPLRSTVARSIVHERSSAPYVLAVRYANKYADQSKSAHLKIISNPINEDICKLDKLVQPVSNHGEFLEPRQLGDLLRRIRRPTNHIVQIKARNPQEPGSMIQVKVMSESELIEFAKRVLRKEQLEKKNEKKNQPKIVEMTWVIGENDLANRLKMVKDFLEQGIKVELTITGKRGMANVGSQQREAFVQLLKNRLQEVEGLREYRSMDGKMERSVTLFFDSPIFIKKKADTDKPMKTNEEEDPEPKKMSAYQLKMAEREKRQALKQETMPRRSLDEQYDRSGNSQRRSPSYAGDSYRNPVPRRYQQGQRW